MTALRVDAIMERPGLMNRHGGEPYFDGRRYRCPDCNGFAERTGSSYRIRQCRTCGHVGLINDRSPHIEWGSPGLAMKGWLKLTEGRKALLVGLALVAVGIGAGAATAWLPPPWQHRILAGMLALMVGTVLVALWAGAGE